MIKIKGLKIPLSYDMQLLKETAAEKLDIEISFIEDISISSKAVNNKNKQDIYFDMDLCVKLSSDEDQVLAKKRSKFIFKENEVNYIAMAKKLQTRPVVIGCGPAGLYAALILAEAGTKPILLERGLDVDSRREKINQFWLTGILDTNTNVQFGEGGAGAFSDGKLKIGMKDARKMKVLNEFVKAGAPEEILYLSKPHIGTDNLNKIVKSIRRKIIGLGGEVRFGAQVKKILNKNGQVTGVSFEKNNIADEISTDYVILAIGHSARDTFKSLLTSGVNIEQRPFAIGLRIEHPQKLIDKLQYGVFAGHPALGAADYRMVVHLQNGRGVYTFCMCPGGMVVAAASENGCLVTNGMSEYARNGRNANTALLVTVDKEDIGSDHPLAGAEYQRRIEEAAFKAGGGGYKAPVQRLEDFINRRNSNIFGDVTPTYLPGTVFAEADSYVPKYIADSLRQGISEMEDWMPGFMYADALLTGVETRSSSPVRIPRGESLEAIGIKGLYPCGEGAGYAGGIVSAAVDGILCAEQILKS